MITITEKAASKVKELLKSEKKESYGLRIEVVPGGCSGFEYGFSFDNKKVSNDTIIEKDGLKVFVDKESLAMIDGATVDFIETLQGAGFKVSNPKAKSSCGCGHSFS